MKNIFFKSTLFTIVLLFFACSDTDNLVIDNVTDNTTSGGILRTLEESTDLPIGLPDSAVHLLLEIQDAEDGNLSDKINVYASFTDIVNAGTNNRDEVLMGTIPSSAFILGNRLPQAEVNVTLVELQTALNLTSDDFTGGDRFVIRVELVFKDGRRWSNDNSSQTVLGNLFLNSPFVYDANVICPVPEDYLVGNYLMEKTSAEEDPFFPAFGQAFSSTGQIVNITASGSQRNFEFSYYPDPLGTQTGQTDPGFASSYNMKLTFLCGNIEALGTIMTGSLGCGSGSIGQKNAIPPSQYDLSNDTVVIVNILDFEPDGGCDTGNYPVTLRFTKQ